MLREATYWLGQNARMGFFLGEFLVGRRLAAEPGTRSRPMLTKAFVNHMRMLVSDARDLFRADWRNVRDGYYALPDDLASAPLTWIPEARTNLRDQRQVVERRRRNGFKDVRERPDAERLPPYYNRNFHFQTDGYLSDFSARIYDHQTEVLFLGATDAMRRQALVPLGDWVRSRTAAGQRLSDMRCLDVACGTGRFASMVKDTYPRIKLTALDLSEAYLREAQRRLSMFTRVRTVRALAEAMPIADQSQDAITCVYLFHEVPGPVQRVIAAEFARVIAPGGRLILVDSIQYGDRPDYDPMIDGFPQSFHEPFYKDYARTNMDALFSEAGFVPAGATRAFLSKVMVYDKP